MGGQFVEKRPWDVHRHRAVVLVVALAAATVKIWIAATTFGTNDVHSWISFAEGVREYGWIGAYGHEYFTQYNHPPLAGMMLLGINALAEAGIGDVPLLVRLPATVADVVTAMLLFELVRLDRPLRHATAAGVLVALSPVLVVVSGFHGNTDPVFVMFVLMALFLVVRRRPYLAGIAYGLALSVKLIPVVVGPVLLVAVAALGWRKAGAFIAGGLTVFLPLWLPVLLGNGEAFLTDVVGYAGVAAREWGLPQFSVWLGLPSATSDWLAGPGSYVAVLLAAVVPVLLVWRRPDRLTAGVGLSLALFLLLSPAFGMQYLSWPVAAAYLVSAWAATAYNAVASAYVIAVYSNWNGRDDVPRPPWAWYEGVAVGMRPVDLQLMAATWGTLLLVVLSAFVAHRGRPGPLGGRLEHRPARASQANIP